MASIILFLSTTNVIIEDISAVTEDEIYNTMTSTPLKAFMDNVFLISPSIPATQVLLDHCTVALICARFSFRASKSRLQLQIMVKSLIFLPFLLKVKLFHQFVQILLDFWVELLFSLCLANFLLRNLLQKFCQALS